MLRVIVIGVIVLVAEITVFWQVAQWIGGWEAVLLLLAISLAGAWMVKEQGVGVVRQARLEARTGRVPGRPLFDGVLILAAGALLVVPGFLTAIAGLLLVIPYTRAPVRERLIRRWTRRFTARRPPVGAQPPPSAVPVRSVRAGDGPGRSGAQQLGGHRAIEAGGEPDGVVEATGSGDARRV